MANKILYWLKLHKDFFGQKHIKKLRKMAGGDTYTIIYLKMQLLSLQTQGDLYFDGVEETFEKELALELDESEDDVQMTLFFLKSQGLIEIVTDNEFSLSEVKENILSENSSTSRVRRHRAKQKALHCNANETQCNKNETADIDKDIDKDKDIDIDIDIDNPPTPLVPSGENETLFPLELESKFAEWIRYKKEQHRFSYKPVALKGLRSQINRHLESHTPQQIIDVINLSIASGYKGILFDKLDSRSNKQTGVQKVVSYSEIARRLEEQGE